MPPDGRARFGVNGHDVVAGWQVAYMDVVFGISLADALYELPACAEYGHAADSFTAIHRDEVFRWVGIYRNIGCLDCICAGCSYQECRRLECRRIREIGVCCRQVACYGDCIGALAENVFGQRLFYGNCAGGVCRQSDSYRALVGEASVCLLSDFI